jgi:adhesin transport system outer membrane protein
MKVLLFILMLISFQGNATTLREVIQHTLQTSPDILMTTQNRRAVDQQLKQAQAGYWPQIDITAGYGRENSDNSTTRSKTGGDLTLTRQELGLSLSQLLFDGFSVTHRVAQQHHLIESAAYQVKENSENIAILTAEVYLEILRRREIVELNKDNVVIHQKILDQIRSLVEGGVGRQADLQQSVSRLALAKSSLVNARGQLRNTEINYRRITGELPTQLVVPQLAPIEAALPVSAESALEIALANHSSLQMTQADLLAAQAAEQQAKSALMPSLHLELHATKGENLDGVEGDNDDLSAMLKMRYNLFRGGADQARIQESAERTGMAQEAIRRAHRVIEEETLLSWNSLLTIRARLDYLKRHLESTEEVLQSYKEQFKLGQRTLLDVLDSENELFSARASFVSARYAEMLSVLKVLESIGLLLKTLDITPPAETQINQ